MKQLKELYSISAHSGKEKKMRRYVKRVCEQMGAVCHTDEAGNLYAVKGYADTYPCVVAHLDEVHTGHSQGYRVMEHEGVIYGYDIVRKETCGIGADDKNGIWVCLQAMARYDVIKCAFFVGEEIGCVGSSDADMSFFADARFVLQCDRRGGSDFIVNAAGVELCTDEFVKMAGIETYGYHTEHGSVTDVMTLKERGLSVCACNIACGYYNPHTSSEATVWSELCNCRDLVFHIIDTINEVCPHEHTYYGGYASYGKKGSGLLHEYWCGSDTSSQYAYDEQTNDLYIEVEEGLNYGLFDDSMVDLVFENRHYDYPLLSRDDFDAVFEDVMLWHSDNVNG